MTSRSLIIVTTLVVLDQITKLLVSANLRLNESYPVLEGIFHITRVHNTGIAFGFFKGMLFIFIFLSIVVIFFIILNADRFRRGYACLQMGLLFVLAGTIGNLIDRIRLGYVIDFIDLQIWPVFNIADLAITTGAILLIYHIIVISKGRKA